VADIVVPDIVPLAALVDASASSSACIELFASSLGL
jgi:hypothetical protein